MNRTVRLGDEPPEVMVDGTNRKQKYLWMWIATMHQLSDRSSEQCAVSFPRMMPVLVLELTCKAEPDPSVWFKQNRMTLTFFGVLGRISSQLPVVRSSGCHQNKWTTAEDQPE